MKIEQLLVQHLYNSKTASLQGIGKFSLAENIVLPAENDKDFVLPADAISFTYNKNEQEDTALIDFIVQQTRKIKPLASADLDSYCMLGKQFLNIGKPFRIEGIGTLQKNQSGDYDFTPGQFVSPKMEPAVKPLKEKFEPDGTFTRDTRNTGISTGRKVFMAVFATLVIGFLAGGAWLLYKRYSKESTTIADNKVQPVKEVPTPGDSSKMSNAVGVTDTGSKAVLNNPATPAVTAIGTGVSYKVIFLTTTDKLGAIKKMTKLNSWGHHIVMNTTDSLNYTLAEAITGPISDTARVVDSLRRNFYPKGKLVVVQ